jgi:hypothetical protein
MQVTQGLWFIAAGAAAEATSPAAVIAASGLVGAIGAVVLTASHRAGHQRAGTP